jgi:CRP-like cAMP-binding protein/Fe-S-cluster-containing hydrogenase component 2
MAKRKPPSMPPATLEGELLDADALLALDIFRGVDRKLFDRFPGTIARRRYKAGEVICREGEGGTTAFHVLDGEVRVFIQHKLERRETVPRPGHGWAARLIATLLRPHRPTRPPHEHDAAHLIPIDASVDLTYGDAAATMGAGDLFGEMSCLNLSPRSATVVAQSDCVLLEILRNMFEALQASDVFAQRMDELYRERALRGHLRNVPMLAGVSEEHLEQLRQSVELVRVPAGEAIFHEGDPADAMYIIRIGQVKVSQRTAGGERTLAYLTRSDCFGETGLLGKVARNATCRAVDHPIEAGGKRLKGTGVELVRLNREQFDWIVRQYPDVKARLEALVEQRVHGKAQVDFRLAQSPQVESLGLLQGQNLMLIDLDKCTRCDQCVDACVASHDDGVTRLVREGPRYDKYLVPSSCRMCRDPVCMIGCPVGSIRRTADLQIIIEDWCIGCEKCAKQCPYDAIQMYDLEQAGLRLNTGYEQMLPPDEIVQVTQQAIVCDQCASLPTGPACVYACPHDAAQRVNAVTFFESMDAAGSAHTPRESV